MMLLLLRRASPIERSGSELGESNERGDAGGEDDEEQTHNHLIGSFGIILLPVPHDGP